MKNYHIIKLPEGITPDGMTKTCVKIPDCKGEVIIHKSSVEKIEKTRNGFKITVK